MSVPSLEVDVLIIGAGPAGASLACFLAQNGIANGLCISSSSSTAKEPRAHYTNLATMDALRDLGVEKECYASATTGDDVGHIRFSETLAGVEYGRAWLGGNMPSKLSEYAKASPSRVCDLPQTYLEPILVKYATTRGFPVRFSTEFVGFEEKDDGRIRSVLRDLVTGIEFHVVSRFLCGADGGRSKIVQLLDMPQVSQPGPPAWNIMVKAEMGKLMTHRKGTLHTCLRLEKDHPFLPLWRVVRPWTDWILILFPKPGQVFEPPITDEGWMEIIHDTIGDSSIKAEITKIARWLVNDTYAEQYSSGNVFCLGDAVHRHPPTGGLGSNTCIQDAYNLAWKMSLVLKGHASKALLETFSHERQPVGKAVVRRANDALKEYAPVYETLGVFAPDPEARSNALAALASPGEEGDALRKKLREGLHRIADREMNALGIEMGQLYDSSTAIVSSNEAGAFERKANELIDGIAHYEPCIYPGRRLPHAWLERPNPAGRVSTVDLAGKGAFCILTGASGVQWKEAAKLVSDKLDGVKINGYSIGFGQDWEDVYGDWWRLCEETGIQEDGCVLVRPDLFVAWRSKTAAADGRCEDALLKVMKSILGV